MTRISTTSGFAVCVAGVPGVGKTKTLLTLSERRPNTQALPGSSVLRSVIAPATTAEFDQWPPERRDRARELAIQRLIELREESPGELLVDGHFSLRERGTGRLHRVFTPADLAFYDALVLLDAPTEQILAWRAADSRVRAVESAPAIDEHRDYERAQAIDIAQLMSVPFLIVDAVELDERVAAVAQFLDNARGIS